MSEKKKRNQRKGVGNRTNARTGGRLGTGFHRTMSGFLEEAQHEVWGRGQEERRGEGKDMDRMARS